jgi:hypothetical protein
MNVAINQELTVEVIENETHEWLMPTKDVAEGYGLSESGLRSTRSRNADELIEGKHFILAEVSSVSNRDARQSNLKSTQTLWTKRGVARLGFFIKTPMAKEFRDWAEDYIIAGHKAPTQVTPILPNDYLSALKELVAKQELLQLQAPKVQTYDAIMATTTSWGVMDAAKVVQCQRIV